jgi:hypothetical protein
MSPLRMPAPQPELPFLRVAAGGPAAGTPRELGLGFATDQRAAGAVAYLADGGIATVPALPITPVDTTGAGDTFVGVLAAALDHGAALAPALREASAAAGLAWLMRSLLFAMGPLDPPVFLAATEGIGIPQLKRLILCKGETVVMEPSLEQGLEALNARMRGTPAPPGGPAPPSP